MTDEANKTDATPEKPAVEAETKTSATAEKKPHRVRNKRASYFSFTSWVLLILLGASGYGIWYVTGVMKQHQQNTIAMSQQLSQTLQAQTRQLEQQLQRNTQYESAIKDLKNALESLLQTNNHLRRDWLLAEAEYLIKLANHRLLLMRDVETSIVALTAADQRLSDIGDPLLIHLRQELRTDIQNLKAVPKVDIVGISLTLSAVSKQVAALPLRTKDPKAIANSDNTNSAAESSKSWHELPAAIWQDIKNMFTVRHHDQPIQKLLTAEQQFFITQNVALQLEQARLAVMNGQTEIYRDKLRGIVTTIRDYYDVEAEITTQLLTTLDELAQKNIQQTLPDISNSLKQVDSYMHKAVVPVIKQSETKSTQPATTSKTTIKTEPKKTVINVDKQPAPVTNNKTVTPTKPVTEDDKTITNATENKK